MPSRGASSRTASGARSSGSVPASSAARQLLRFGLVPLRENAEEVALHGGEQRERGALGARVVAIVENWSELVRAQKRLAWRW